MPPAHLELGLPGGVHSINHSGMRPWLRRVAQMRGEEKQASGGFRTSWNSIKTEHSTLLWPRTATLRGLGNTPLSVSLAAATTFNFLRWHAKFTTSSRLGKFFCLFPRVARELATLGFVAESLQDSGRLSACKGHRRSAIRL